MFGLFKKKTISQLPISKAIVECKKNGAKDLSINLYIEDQILFQVIMAKHFQENGLETQSIDDMAIIHFFNKNKTLTINTWNKFKIEKLELEYLHYEKPKGVFVYLKNVGNNPKKIEDAIQKEILKYDLTNDSKISIEYTS